jgi:hypothetical protein
MPSSRDTPFNLRIFFPCVKFIILLYKPPGFMHTPRAVYSDFKNASLTSPQNLRISVLAVFRNIPQGHDSSIAVRHIPNPVQQMDFRGSLCECNSSRRILFFHSGHHNSLHEEPLGKEEKHQRDGNRHQGRRHGIARLGREDVVELRHADGYGIEFRLPLQVD